MAKAIAFLLAMTLMVSTFMVRANAFNVASSSRSLLSLQFFTNFADGRRLSIVEASAAPAATPPTVALASSVKEEKKGQTFVNWFEAHMGSIKDMFRGPQDNKASASAPAA